jgi:serine/threonine protein kinase
MSVSHELVDGRYRLVRQLGAGGMGRVWLARDEMLHRDVAIKEVVPPDGLTDEEYEELRERTLREARTTARLNHPHVVQIYDVIQTEQWPWIVMEYVRSRSLHQIIKQNGPLSPQRAAQIGLAVLAALRAAHAAGVLHRDIKPANVLLSDDGRVVLTDFGLATFDGVESAVTRPGLVLGTALYVAPERARDGTSSPEADLWSLGATLYAAVEGRSPYARPTTLATLTALATEPPDPARNAGPLRPVLSGLLRRSPRARPSAAEAQKMLEKVAAGQAKPRQWLAPRPRTPRSPIPAEPFGSDLLPASGSGSGVTPPALSSATLATPSVATDLLSPGTGSGDVGSGGSPSVEGGEGLVGVGLADGGSGSGGQTRPTERLRPPRWRIGVLAALLVALVAAPAWAVFSAERDSRHPAEPDNSAPPAPPAWLAQDAGLCKKAFSAPDSTERPPPSAPLPSGPGQAREFAPLPGWGYYRQADGLRIVAPNPWAFARTDSMVCFRDPTHVLGVQTTWSPNGDVTEAMQRLEEQLLRSGDLPGYSPVGMEPKPNFYASAAEWEYTYDGEGGEMLRVRMRGFVTATGQAYAIFLLTQEIDSPFLNTYWDSILVGFAPARIP